MLLKKVRIGIGVALFVTLLIPLVVPFVQGIASEARIREALGATEQALAPALTAQIVSYRRGWFDADVKAIIGVRIGEITERFTGSFRVIHGPIPLLEIVRAKAPFEIFEARIHGVLNDVYLDPKALANARTKPRAPIEINAVVGLGSKLRAKVVFSKFDKPARAIAWQTGSLTLSTANNFQRAAAEGIVRGIRIRDRANDRSVRLGVLRTNVTPDPKSDREVAEVSLEAVNATAKDWHANANQLVGQLSATKTAPGTPLITGSITLPEVLIRYRDYIGVNFGCYIRGITAAAEMRFQKQRATLAAQYRMGTITTVHSAYGPIDGRLNLTMTGEQAPRDVMQWIRELGSADEKNLPDTRKRAAKASKVAEASADLELQADSSIKIKRAGQLSQLDMQSVQYPLGKPETIVGEPTDKPNGGALGMDIDERLFDAVLYEIVDLFVQRTSYFEQEAKGDKKDAVEKLLGDLEKSNIFIKQSGRYQTKVEWRGTRYKVNRKPLDGWSLIKALALREVVLHPRLSLRIEDLERSGGLTQEQITASVKEAVKKLANCVWQGRNAADTPNRDKFRVAWEIDKKAKARMTGITTNARINTAVKACIQKVLESDTPYPAASKPTTGSFAIRYDILRK